MVYENAVPASLTSLMDVLNQFPHEKSVQLLAQLGRFDSLLDIGAGININLANHVVNELGAAYSAVDNGITKDENGTVIDTADLLNRRLSAAQIAAVVHKADVLELSSEIEPADIVHMRFVLAHSGKKEAALKEALKKTKKYLVVMDYNWQPIRSTVWPRTIQLFKEASIALMRCVGSNPYMGNDLRELVERVVPADQQKFFQKFSREERNYLEELLALCAMQIYLTKSFGLQYGLGSEFKKLMPVLLDIFEAGKELPFVPADICCAVIRL